MYDLTRISLCRLSTGSVILRAAEMSFKFKASLEPLMGELFSDCTGTLTKTSKTTELF